MSALSNLAALLGITQPSRGGYMLQSFGRGNLSGESVTTENAMDNPIVLSAVNLIADGIAQLPWNVVDGTGGVLADNNISGIVRRPNAFQSPFEFKKALVTSIMMYGNAYINIIRNGDNRPQQLVLIDPKDVGVTANRFGIPLYRIHGREQPVEHRDMIHIRDIVDFSAIGKSRVELAGDAIGLYRGTTRFAGNMLKRGGVVSGILSFKGGLDSSKRDSLRDAFKAFKNNGGQQAGDILITEGDAQYSSMDSFTAADAELRQFRLMLIDEIAGVFRVPSFAIGGGGDEKYNNVGQKYSAMYRDTFAPLLASIEETMTSNLLQGERRLQFDVSILTKGDRTTQIDNVIKQVDAGILTPNEARAELGMADVDGGDELAPRGMSLNLSPGAQNTGGNGNDG